MNITNLNFDDIITIALIIGQAGVVYYRLRKVEQKTDKFNELLIEFAVQKNALALHKNDFEKQSTRFETMMQRLDERLSGVETHAYEALLRRGKKNT